MGDEPSPTEPEHTFREGALERIIDALGSPLFEFVLNSSVEEVADGSAGRTSIAVAQELDDFLLTEHQGETNPAAWAEVLKSRLTDTGVPGGPLALMLRLRCGATDVLPEGVDEIERVLVRIAARVYPSLLLPPDPRISEFGFAQRPFIGGALHRDPEATVFQDMTMLDPVFAKVYSQETPESGRYGMIYCSTGRGGSIQLWTLAEQIVQAAWAEQPTTMADYAMAVIDQFRFTKNAFAGKEQTVHARMAFAGVLLPNGKSYSFGDVTLRTATQSEIETAPESVSGQLTTTDENGIHTLINYAGDLIADVDVPYLVSISKQKLEDPPLDEFPQDVLKRNPLESISTRLRAALLLATKRTHRVQIVPSWQSTNDPLNFGPAMSWALKENFVGLMPTQLTEPEMAAWTEWYQLLSTPGAERIQLAISRVIRATAERRDHVDVLVDSVIAWENLFGTKDGEPTLRVTASLALLLESDPGKRRSFRTKLGKIYGLRSDAVHGSALPKLKDASLCYEALDIAIQALRVILKERADLLSDGDGGVRSLKLILGEAPPD